MIVNWIVLFLVILTVLITLGLAYVLQVRITSTAEQVTNASTHMDERVQDLANRVSTSYVTVDNVARLESQLDETTQGTSKQMIFLNEKNISRNNEIQSNLQGQIRNVNAYCRNYANTTDSKIGIINDQMYQLDREQKYFMRDQDDAYKKLLEKNNEFKADVQKVTTNQDNIVRGIDVFTKNTAATQNNSLATLSNQITQVSSDVVSINNNANATFFNINRDLQNLNVQQEQLQNTNTLSMSNQFNNVNSYISSLSNTTKAQFDKINSSLKRYQEQLQQLKQLQVQQEEQVRKTINKQNLCRLVATGSWKPAKAEDSFKVSCNENEYLSSMDFGTSLDGALKIKAKCCKHP